MRITTSVDSYRSQEKKLFLSRLSESSEIFKLNLTLPKESEALALKVPKGVDLAKNIEMAKEMGPLSGPLDFVDNVKTGGDWDYKNIGKPGEYENFGNWHFGLVAAAAGWPLEIALRGAGAYQIYRDTSKPEWGGPWDSSGSYGDDPRDQYWIIEGYKGILSVYQP